MSVIFFALRWVFLISILWAACISMRDFLHLKVGFAPVVAVCGIGLLVYFGGLVGLLRPTTYLLIFLCTLSLGRIVRGFQTNPPVWKGIPFIEGGFVLGMVVFFAVLSQGSLIHYDNFTHWALVVKELLLTHAFPSAESQLITFTNYPTGTASWIYFVCTIVGHGENAMIMAQGLMIFAAIYAIYGVIEERRRFLLTGILTTGLCLLTLFNYSVRINNLLVDFLLPILTLAAISIIHRYRKEPESLYLLPIMGFLMAVKSTGIVYASLAMAYLVYNLVRYAIHSDLVGNHPWNYPQLRKLWTRGLASLFLSILPFVCWNVHTDSVFADAVHKFETDIDVIAANVKSPEEIDLICRLYWDVLSDFTQRGTIGILLFQALAMLACFIGCVFLKKKWALPQVLLVMDIVLILYLLGILAMYIYSMPMEEALYLAAFERYSSSIVVLFGGVLTIVLTIDVEHSFYYRVGEVEEIRSFKTVETKYLYLRGCGACIVLSALILTSEYNGMVAQETAYQDSLSIHVKAVVGDVWTPEVDQARYLVIANDDDGLVSNYYLEYVSKYYLRAVHVDTVCMFYEPNFLSLLRQYDYLVIVDASAETKILMQDYLGQSGEPGIYDLSAILPA